MRVDSHQHFWRYNTTDYVWMTDAMRLLRRDYLQGELEPHLRSTGFDGTICVQARQMEEETEWLLELAAQYEFIQCVVGWVDFASPQLEERLERFAENPKLRGVRELIHDMPDDNYAVSDMHVAAIAKLARLGLTYDLLLKPRHLGPAEALVRQFPNQLFVVDHIAKPEIRSGVVDPWCRDMAVLAANDNVYCKLSGMVTEATWGHWQLKTFRPYLEWVLDVFGAARLMIGSDWPVCTLSGSYEATMQVVIDFAAELSDRERDAILGNNAAEFYGITRNASDVLAAAN